MECKKIIIGIGNRLRCDDAAGSIAAHKLSEMGLCSIDAENMPENFISVVRRKKPDKIVIIDACNMNLSPGQIRKIDIQKISSTVVTTHSLPIRVIVQQLVKITSNVVFIGIQTENVEIGESVSNSVQKAIDRVVEKIQNGLEDTISQL